MSTTADPSRDSSTRSSYSYRLTRPSVWQADNIRTASATPARFPKAITPNDILTYIASDRLAKPTLFLIDGSNQMYRAYHAIRGLTGPDGRSTNAVYGFVTMLRKLIADHKPECIAAAFDLRGPTFRSELRDDYKANRAPMPSDLAEQIEYVHEACEALGVQVLTYAGFEADDVIGTLAARSE